jgi:hypothetical protein
MKIPADLENGLKHDSSNRMAPHRKKVKINNPHIFNADFNSKSKYSTVYM